MCHVTSSQVFIVGSPLEPILNATLDNDNATNFYCQPYMSLTILIKDKISFTKFALTTKIKLHNFLSHLQHICKMYNSFFYMVANCATFQKTKKKAVPKARKRIPLNLGGQFATPRANVPTFINILTLMFQHLLITWDQFANPKCSKLAPRFFGP